VTDAAEVLLGRLTTLGLRPVERLRATDNRSVLVSLSTKRVLSVHRGFALAPDRVLKAIVRFVSRGTTRDLRKAAQHEIVSYHQSNATDHLDHLDHLGRPARRDRPRPGDAEALQRLGLLFQALNQRHFTGSLPDVPIRLSGRMRTRLGHLSLDRDGRPTDITISRRHLAAHGWDETEHTLLHEMVHLWQCTVGHAVDHGPKFRAKAREVGAVAAARRWVTRPTHDARRTTHDAPKPKVRNGTEV
jgi:hypothetical protein